MKNTIHRVYVGDEADARSPEIASESWSIVHAAKYPWHAKLLGYTGAAPVKHPERYVAERPQALYLNLVDAKQQRAELVMPILEKAKAWIDGELMKEKKVLVHCNKGLSRAPAVVLWWYRLLPGGITFSDAVRVLFGHGWPIEWESGIVRLVREKWDDHAGEAEH